MSTTTASLRSLVPCALPNAVPALLTYAEQDDPSANRDWPDFDATALVRAGGHCQSAT